MEPEVRMQAPRKTRIFDLEVIYGIYPVEQDSPYIQGPPVLSPHSPDPYQCLHFFKTDEIGRSAAPAEFRAPRSTKPCARERRDGIRLQRLGPIRSGKISPAGEREPPIRWRVVSHGVTHDSTNERSACFESKSLSVSSGKRSATENGNLPFSSEV
jgi:hypothetical protein